MADTKISALTAITGDVLASGDLTVVVDVSDTTMAASGTDKKITVAELAAAIAAADPYTARSPAMATTPAFASTVIVGTGTAPATLDTSLTAPSNATTLTFSAAIGSSGAKIEELRVIGLATTVASNLNVFLYDGSTYHLFDQFNIIAITSSTTAVAYYESRRYDNLFVPSGWSVRFTVTVSGNQSNLKLFAMGANF